MWIPPQEPGYPVQGRIPSLLCAHNVPTICGESHVGFSSRLCLYPSSCGLLSRSSCGRPVLPVFRQLSEWVTVCVVVASLQGKEVSLGSFLLNIFRAILQFLKCPGNSDMQLNLEATRLRFCPSGHYDFSQVAIKTGMGMFFFTSTIFLQWVFLKYCYSLDTEIQHYCESQSTVVNQKCEVFRDRTWWLYIKIQLYIVRLRKKF